MSDLRIQDECELCEYKATWRVYAAYDDDNAMAHQVHPQLKRYPNAMAKLCTMHIQVYITMDQQHDGATSQYVLKKIP